MSCQILQDHQTCCEKTIKNIIEERNEQLKTTTILFYCQTVSDTEFLNKLHKNLSPARVLLTSREFDKAWEAAIDQVQTYKKRVISRKIELPIILHDIDYFINNEKNNYDLIKRNINVKLNMIEEERRIDILAKVDKLDILFTAFVEDLEKKRQSIVEEEDYMPLVIKEIDANLKWFRRQKCQADRKFKEKVNCMVQDLINSNIVKTYKAGKNITLSILKLEEKLRQKKKEMGEDDEGEVCEEISKLQLERSSLDYQAATLADLENVFQKLLKEQNEIFDKMKTLEEELNANVQEIMDNECLNNDEKEMKIRELRCSYDEELCDLQSREYAVHGKIERIRQEILSKHEAFDVNLLQKIGMDNEYCCESLTAVGAGTFYHFDQHGRYFINEKGLKIYKTDCSSKAYLMDDNGNMLEIRMEGSQVTFIKDSDYLKYHVGDALKKGMAQIFLYQPLDPISYLANYIIKYRRNVISEEERKRDLDDLLLREDRTC